MDRVCALFRIVSLSQTHLEPKITLTGIVQKEQEAHTGHEPPAKRRKVASKEAALPWMRVPVTVAPGEAVNMQEVRGLHPQLAAAFAKAGYHELFPVQAAAWHVLGGGLSDRHDLCIAAPTGSGKTLAYALPVLQRCLHREVSMGTQALVVVPTRSLAQQVFDVLAALSKHLPSVSVGLANGTASVRDERAMIHHGTPAPPVPTLPSLLPAATLVLPSVQDWSVYGAAHEIALSSMQSELAGCSTQSVKVLVATPGRLVHHLGCGGKWLSSVDILVVDEIDRLLRQEYQGWLPKLLAAIHESPSAGTLSRRRVIKLVVSATLTRDPAKVARLQLEAPRYISLEGKGERHKLPENLREWTVVTAAAQKPVALVALLEEFRGEKTLVLASSVDATHRLATLLNACDCIASQVAEYSSLVPTPERNAALKRFRAGTISVIVASDSITRGMDLPGVTTVINYDMPTHAKTYVHRAGRTARAGKAGKVFTILRTEHVKPFKAMLRKADNNFVRDYSISEQAWDAVREDVHRALAVMKHSLIAEDD